MFPCWRANDFVRTGLRHCLAAHNSLDAPWSALLHLSSRFASATNILDPLRRPFTPRVEECFMERFLGRVTSGPREFVPQSNPWSFNR